MAMISGQISGSTQPTSRHEYLANPVVAVVEIIGIHGRQNNRRQLMAG